MKKTFKITDLGVPKYVIGVHIDYNRTEHRLKLNQRLYIETLTEKIGQVKLRPTILPSMTSVKIEKDMGSPSADGPYRSLIGNLIYVTLKRPVVVTIVSQLL